jgi:hypothetical protein
LFSEKIRQLPNGHGTSTTSTVTLTKSESLREQTRPKSISDSYIHTRTASYKGERPDHRIRSPDQKGLDDYGFRLSLARIDSGEVHPTLVEEMSPENSPRGRLVVEVDGSGRSLSVERPLETERAEFSQNSPQFYNPKLSQQYELSQNGLTGSGGSASSLSRSTGGSVKGVSQQALENGAGKDRNGSGKAGRNGGTSAMKSSSSLTAETVEAHSSNSRRLSQQSDAGSIDSSGTGAKPKSSQRLESGKGNGAASPRPKPDDKSRSENGLSANSKHGHSSGARIETTSSTRPKSQPGSENGNSLAAKQRSSPRPSDDRRASRDSLSSSSSGAERIEKPARTFQKGASMERQTSGTLDTSVRASATSQAVVTPVSAAADVHTLDLPGAGRSVVSLNRNPNLDDGGSVCSSFTSSDSNYEALEKQILSQVGFSTEANSGCSGPVCKSQDQIIYHVIGVNPERISSYSC